MTSRSDISPNKHGWRRLSYTRRCGFVDWGHALPGSAMQLRNRMELEVANQPGLSRLHVSLEGMPAYVIDYGQQMTKFGITVMDNSQWVVRKRLPVGERERAALGIFMAASTDFERLQSTFPFSISDSGFSAEDLVSDLIGFYAAFHDIPEIRLRAICGETSVEESQKMWDDNLPNGIGAVKNYGFTPKLFTTKIEATACIDTSFPEEFSNIAAAQPGSSWVRVKTRFIDGFLVNAGATIDVSSAGVVRVH